MDFPVIFNDATKNPAMTKIVVIQQTYFLKIWSNARPQKRNYSHKNNYITSNFLRVFWSGVVVASVASRNKLFEKLAGERNTKIVDDGQKPFK